jgi:hypothetical protein
MIYCEARLLRAGLANRLFPWARARIWSRKHQVRMLFPQWAQIPFGTLLRREKDLRTYTNLFQPAEGDIRGLHAAYVRLTAKPAPEPASLLTAVEPIPGSQLVVFEGMKGQFAEINGFGPFLRPEVEAMTLPTWRTRAQAFAQHPFIGLHVRRGDFQRSVAPGELATTNNAITPIDWFVDTLKAVREVVGPSMPAIVTSDGTDEDLEILLAEPNITRADTGSAIGDMLLLSRAEILLGSGSSFSAWAAFLRDIPTLTHPGQSLTRLFGLTSEKGRLQVFDPANPIGLIDLLGRRAASAETERA